MLWGWCEGRQMFCWWVVSCVVHLCSGVCMCSHRPAEPFLRLPARMQYHCPTTSWAQDLDNDVLAIGWTSCDNKKSARAGAESYMTRTRHSPKAGHRKIKAACPSLYLAICLLLVVLSQMSLPSDLTDTQQHQLLALSPGSWTPGAGCGSVVCTLAPGD